MTVPLRSRYGVGFSCSFSKMRIRPACSMTNKRPSFGGEVASTAPPLTRPIWRTFTVEPDTGVQVISGGASNSGAASAGGVAASFFSLLLPPPPPQAAATSSTQADLLMGPILAQGRDQPALLLLTLDRLDEVCGRRRFPNLLGPFAECPQDQADQRERHEKHPTDEALEQPERDQCE